MVVVLDLGLGQRRALHHRPHHRLGAAIELAAHGELQQFPRDHRFGRIVHRQIRVGEIARHAEALELLGLDGDPVGGEVAAFLAEFVDRHLVLVLALGAVLLLDLPFDRQAVAVPAGDVVGVVAAHLEGAGDDVLQDLVERMADMEVAVGIGRAVVQDVFRTALALLSQRTVKVHRVPLADPFGLGLGQAGAHRKLGLRQEQRLGVVDAVRPGLARRFGRSVGLGVHEDCHVVRRGTIGAAQKRERGKRELASVPDLPRRLADQKAGRLIRFDE